MGDSLEELRRRANESQRRSDDRRLAQKRGAERKRAVMLCAFVWIVLIGIVSVVAVNYW